MMRGLMLCLAICGSCVAVICLADAPETARAPAALQLGPETTVFSAPLNSDGYPDYIAILEKQAEEGVAPEDNFWVQFMSMAPSLEFGQQYAEVLRSRPGFERVLEATPRFVGVQSMFADSAQRQAIEDQQEVAMTRPWSAEEFPRLAEWLDLQQVPLDVACEAALRPKAFAPMVTHGESRVLSHVLLPHVQSTRPVAHGLVTRGFFQLASGRQEEAWRDALACLRISRHLRRSPFTVERLFGAGEVRIARPLVEGCLVASRTESELAARWRELSLLLESPPYSEVLQGERLMCLDALLALRAGNLGRESFRQPMTPGQPGELVDVEALSQSLQTAALQSGDVNVLLRQCNQYYDALTESLKEPTYAGRSQALDAAMTEFGVSGAPSTPGNVAFNLLLGGSDGLEHVARQTLLRQLSIDGHTLNHDDARHQATVRMMHAMCAAELYDRSRGEDVANGLELLATTPALAAEHGVGGVPALLDPFTDAPFVVRVDEQALRISSMGPNQRVEDGIASPDAAAADDITVRLPRR